MHHQVLLDKDIGFFKIFIRLMLMGLFLYIYVVNGYVVVYHQLGLGLVLWLRS